MRVSRTTMVTCGALAVLGAVSLWWPESRPTIHAVQSADPEQLELIGIVRDFKKSHPDFNITLASGNGHYAGNVAKTLYQYAWPSYTGGGFKVAAEWKDSSGNNIAPHMHNYFSYGSGCYSVPGICADGLLAVNNQAEVDSFNSSLGPYGGSNVGADAMLATNSTGSSMLRVHNSSEVNGNVYGGPGGNMNTIYTTHPSCVLTGTKSTLANAIPMPVIIEPEMPISVGNMTYTGTSHVISSDLHVNNLNIQAGAVVEVQNDATILVDGNATINGQLKVAGTLNLYVKGELVSWTGQINMNTGMPQKCAIFKMGTGTFDFNGNSAKVAARLFAPETTLTVRQSSEVFGTFVGKSIEIDNNARFHVDTGVSGTMNFSADVMGAKGINSNGGVTSPSTFAQWYTDMPGSNIASLHTVVLPKDSNGYYHYATTAFHPCDNKLFGNEGADHNHHLTYTISALFDYEACAGQMFEFRGGDDVFVYIGGKLVIDLGGIKPAVTQRISLDRLGLTPGKTYQLLFCYAQRTSTSVDFEMKTNIVLTTTGVSANVTEAFD